MKWTSRCLADISFSVADASACLQRRVGVFKLLTPGLYIYHCAAAPVPMVRATTSATPEASQMRSAAASNSVASRCRAT